MARKNTIFFMMYLPALIVACMSITYADDPEVESLPATILVDPGDTESSPVNHAIAVMYPTEGQQVTGIVEFLESDSEDGVRVMTRIKNLPAGSHGYHIHLYGDCSSGDAESAGTHFNFTGSSENPPKDIKHITGDLGELDAGENGEAEAEVTIKNAQLQGAYSIIGRSVIIHEKGNDPQSPPIGAAGSRLACGVIGITQ